MNRQSDLAKYIHTQNDNNNDKKKKTVDESGNQTKNIKNKHLKTQDV